MKQKINVIISGPYFLLLDSLAVFLESKNHIKVIDTAISNPELLEKCLAKRPDIVLFCLTPKARNLDAVPLVSEVSPRTKFVILIHPGSVVDQRRAVEMGVSGVVELNQNPCVLVQAIERVYGGETWLSQKLISILFEDKRSFDENAAVHRSNPNDLTKREIEIIDIVLLGMSNRQMSEKLGISEATVRHHLSSIYSKLYVDGRLNLVLHAYRYGVAGQTVTEETGPN